jgi:hypothetical protein
MSPTSAPLEFSDISQIEDVRRRIVSHEPVSDEELAAVVAFSRAGRSSAAMSSAKSAKGKAKKEANAAPVNLGSLFGE